MKRKLILVTTILFIAGIVSACGYKIDIKLPNRVIKKTNSPISIIEKSEVPETSSLKPSKELETISIPFNKEDTTSDIDFEDYDVVCSDFYYETILMPTPPFEYFKSDKIKDSESQSIKLKMKLSKANKIIDESYWFLNNKLSLNTLNVTNPFLNTKGNTPDAIEETWNDLILTRAFYDDTYIYCTYGNGFSEGYILNIYDNISYQIVYSLDFSNYKYSPEFIEDDYDYIQQRIEWAEIKNNILYISHMHNTYAISSKNKNAYLTAIDLSDMSILWRSEALVSNSRNFLIMNNIIISGYGFTAETDYLYQIDISTGKVLDKILLKSAPDYIIEKDNILYVRTYNTDYEFEILQ